MTLLPLNQENGRLSLVPESASTLTQKWVALSRRSNRRQPREAYHEGSGMLTNRSRSMRSKSDRAWRMVDAGHHLEQLAGQMARCSGSSRRIIDFARASLGIGDELGNRLSRDRWIYRHDKWCADNASDWRDIADEIVVELVVECRIDRVPCANNEQRVAVGRGTHDRLGADIASATRPVVDNKLLAEALRQRLTYQAREDVARTRRSEGHDQMHRPRRIGLRPSEA